MNYFKLWLVITIITLPCINLDAQNKTTNTKKLFDYDWKFYLGDNDDASKINFDDSNWRMLDLPHDWSIESDFSSKNPAGNDGAYLPTGIGWYRKTFKIAKDNKNKVVIINFEGVYMNSEVFINGKSLGIYPYGYTSFSYELTPYLDYEKENVIAVRVDNSKQKNSRWYSGSGIYRHVWLKSKGRVHFENDGIGISTPIIKSNSATVEVSTTIKNNSDQPKSIQLETIIFDSKNNKEVKKSSITVQIDSKSKKTIKQNLKVSKPKLWSPESPNLYNAKVSLIDKEEIADQSILNFGIRSISFSATEGFLLNGKTTLLNGGCVHHDNGALGAASYDRAEERKVELLKEAGFNALRTSHNPPSQAFLEACDRLGMLVIDEAFDGWRTKKTEYDYAMYFDKWYERDVQAMVKRDRNHPSVIMWSIGNEIIERKEPQAVATAKNLANAVKAIDTTRPVTSAMTTWDKDWEIFDPLMAEHDVAGYNYELKRAPDDHKRVPTRVIVQTESYPREAFQNWKLVNENKYIIGDFVWTAMDYLGESGIGRWYYSGEVTGEHWERDLFPWHGAYCGDIDMMGWRKPISHYRSMLYNNNEKLYLAVKEPNPDPLEIIETRWSVWPTWESWTWPEFLGKEIQVEVYSKYPKVRLYLNDKIVGESETNSDTQFKATFSVPYNPGQLKAVGLQNGKETESKILKTAGKATKIVLKADRNNIKADGQDLSYVTLEIVDEFGTIVPNADLKIQFTISESGSILGTDNANIKDVNSYVSQTRMTWKGKALAIIKSNRTKGEILLSASADGLATATLKIKTE
ncbi:glycoside hydrolase family 2 TIM barrel-domain containing protein [Flavobacterium eburneipallidum]|uniref:glycoside hydrolase family 2 TIM barrel-domain containing protein n=1 Tax=Flavobacterium eburneipallidum TaxID=3003263 RepID=UPI0024823FBD|nr:glycoside hydrolase family 2 TIM barrel-domain containing protein [Flavobacterium eburneipallidum]